MLGLDHQLDAAGAGGDGKVAPNRLSAEERNVPGQVEIKLPREEAAPAGSSASIMRKRRDEARRALPDARH
jgi:hypothetical protein